MWTKSAGLNWDIPCGELARDHFLEWNEPPGIKSRWQGSVAALLSRDPLAKGMHRKSRFEYSCTSHSQTQHMCLNGYPRAIQSGGYYLQYSDIIAWASYMGVLGHEPSLVRQCGQALQDWKLHRLREVTGEDERDGKENWRKGWAWELRISS